MSKKIYLAAALVALTAVAQAQSTSSITLYGRIDTRFFKDPGTATKAIGNGSGSRLGFKGVEDLGGGLSAFFDLQHRLNADTGAQTNAQRFFQQSFVGLANSYGRIWFGRDYTPAYINVMLMPDPFEHSFAGSFLTINTGGVSRIRVDSSVNAQTKLGRVTGTVQIAEASDTIDNFPNRPKSLSLVYADKAIKLGYGYENPGNNNDYWHQVSGTYDIGAFSALAGFGKGQTSTSQERKAWSVAGGYSLGQHRLFAIYGRLENDTANVTLSSKASLGWQYYLSKRTNVYASLARDSKLTTEKSGYDIGLRHNF